MEKIHFRKRRQKKKPTSFSSETKKTMASAALKVRFSCFDQLARSRPQSDLSLDSIISTKIDPQLPTKQATMSTPMTKASSTSKSSLAAPRSAARAPRAAAPSPAPLVQRLASSTSRGASLRAQAVKEVR